MGNFLIVIAQNERNHQAASLFERGLRLARGLKGLRETADILTRTNLWVAAFPRQNGSGGKIFLDEHTGGWILSIGTWVHADDSNVSSEKRLIAMIREQGASDIARHLEGFFVIAGGNERTDLFIITDIIGSCHAYSRSWNGITAISSSSLLLAALDRITLDPIGCQEFILGGVIYEDRTLYQEVRKLRPATHYNYKNGLLAEQKCYWSSSELKPESLDGNAAIDALRAAIQNAVRKIGTLAPKLLCDLTGGYDSRTLVAGFLSAGIPISTAVSGLPDSPDVRVSSALAALAALPNVQSDPEPIRSYDQILRALQLTDGEYDIVEYARVNEIHREHSKTYDLSLNGSFGEVARGYWWEILAPHTGKARALDAVRVARLRYIPRGFDPTLFSAEKRLNLEEHYAAIIRRNNIGLEDRPNTFQLDNIYLRLRMQRWQGRIASSTNQIWPCLSPFMFRSILEVMLQTSYKLRRRSLFIRKLLPELDIRFAKYPLEHGFPPVPGSLRTLHQFWPIVPLYVGKAIHRLKRFGKRAATSTGQSSASSRLQLWNDPDIIEILRPDKMLCTNMLDANALGAFLNRSCKDAFPCEGQWARVLTFECTLRSLKEAESIR